MVTIHLHTADSAVLNGVTSSQRWYSAGRIQTQHPSVSRQREGNTWRLWSVWLPSVLWWCEQRSILWIGCSHWLRDSGFSTTLRLLRQHRGVGPTEALQTLSVPASRKPWGMIVYFLSASVFFSLLIDNLFFFSQPKCILASTESVSIA